MPEEHTKLHPAAFRELKAGETYEPIVPASQSVLEITIRSVAIGLIMAVIFSLASAYLALKAGQGMEPAIPIAILAVGMAGLFARRSTILENVIIQSIGAASGSVVAGAVFTIPALYMLGLKVSFWQIFLTAFLGGCLGVFFLIPLRQFLMVKEHGKLPFPEAMATTEILVTGEGAGSQAKILIWSASVAFFFDLCVLTFGLWREIITFHSVKFGSWLENRFAMAFRVDGLAAIVSAQDVQATLLELTASACRDCVNSYSNDSVKLIVCGGGAFNLGLMQRLQTLLPMHRVQSSAEAGLPPQQVEAAAFAWLARKAIYRETLSLENITGAKGARTAGAVYPA